jgi:hypothetical protein
MLGCGGPRAGEDVLGRGPGQARGGLQPVQGAVQVGHGLGQLAGRRERTLLLQYSGTESPHLQMKLASLKLLCLTASPSRSPPLAAVAAGAAPRREHGAGRQGDHKHGSRAPNNDDDCLDVYNIRYG